MLPLEGGGGDRELESGEREEEGEPHSAWWQEKRLLCSASVDRFVVVAAPAAESSQKCPRHHLFGKAAFPAFRSPFPVIYPHSVPSSTTISSSHHVPPRPLRISGSPLAPFRCNHSVPHHCCVSSFLGIQPPGRRMSVSVHASMTCLFGH